MARQDPFKIFIGNLPSDIIKPQLNALFAGLGFRPEEVIVPPCCEGKLAYAFATWWTAEEAMEAVMALDGHIPYTFSKNPISAHIWG